MRALVCPASLKGVLGAPAVAAALAHGLRAGGAEVVCLPVADGGEGTTDVLHRAFGGAWHDVVVSDPLGRPVRARWLQLPDGRAIVEAAPAIGLPLLAPDELDPLRASSRGFGELVAAALVSRPAALVLCLGGTATMDGGAGLREVLHELPLPVLALCDVATTLSDAARLFGPQKGATPEDIAVLEERLLGMPELRPYSDRPGAGAAGGLGAALAALGAELAAGAETVLDLLDFPEHLAGCDLAVTAEGTVDETTRAGKAPGVVARRCRAAGVRCVVVGGIVRAEVVGAETVALSGDPARARADLRQLGERLAAGLPC